MCQNSQGKRYMGKMSDIFEESISKIATFYSLKDYQIGWRFLTCSKLNLFNSPSVALITLNPGGNLIPDGHSWGSCENGNAHLSESWKKSEAGKVICKPKFNYFLASW